MHLNPLAFIEADTPGLAERYRCHFLPSLSRGEPIFIELLWVGWGCVSLFGFLSFQGGGQGREQIKSAEGFQIPMYLTYIHKSQQEKTSYKKASQSRDRR